MKRSQFLFPFVLAFLILSSCSGAFYRHQRLLESCQTRDDVSKRLGFPDEINHTKTGEEWTYNLDSHRSNAVVKPVPPVSDSLSTGLVINYDKFLKFSFDRQGNVTGYHSNIPDPVRAIVKRDEHVTVLGVVGATLLIAAIIYIDVVTKSDINF